MDHQQGQGRRGHFHRGRRGPDRRGPERRQPPAPDQAARGEQIDVEQIMRDIRTRIAQRHGIDLSEQQIRELAARRLEAILDPRIVKPALVEQLRKAAGAPAVADLPAASVEPSYTFEEQTIYESGGGFLRLIRRLLNPLLKLFFNPDPVVHALHAQARLNTAAAERENERERRHTEWNALHYELLQRMVNETARLSIEVQNLGLRVESLAAKVDFADRRVRELEAASPTKGALRPEVLPSPPVGALSDQTGSDGGDTPSAEGPRRRRRRRRGRRGSGPFTEAAAVSAGTDTLDAGELEPAETGDEEELGEEPAGDQTAARPAPTADFSATEHSEPHRRDAGDPGGPDRPARVEQTSSPESDGGHTDTGSDGVPPSRPESS